MLSPSNHHEGMIELRKQELTNKHRKNISLNNFEQIAKDEIRQKNSRDATNAVREEDNIAVEVSKVPVAAKKFKLGK